MRRRVSDTQTRQDTHARYCVRGGDLMAAWRRRQTRRTPYPVADWITREFASRGLVPPHCTPEALAYALERERGITIAFVPHASDDPGVYGLVYRAEGRENAYVIVFRPTHSIALRCQTLFHELAHILFRHCLTDVHGVGNLRGHVVADQDDAQAEAFAVGAMQYALLGDAAIVVPPPTSADGTASAFGHFLQRTQYRL
jgi:hypothetical protein